MSTKKTKLALDRRPREQLFPEQEFFVKIDDPNYFRRTILEASKSTLSTLKGIYSVKELRQQKIAKLLRLQHEIREIRLLIQKAEELMPKYTKQQAVKRFTYLVKKKEEPKKEQVKREEPKRRVVQKKALSPAQRTRLEIDRLSESINQVENRMRKLPETRQKVERIEKVQGSVKQGVPQSKTTPNEDLGIELGKALDKIHKKLKEI
jgi:hypothetical protein